MGKALATRERSAGLQQRDAATGLEVKRTAELAVSTAQATAQREIEAAVLLARRFPRNEAVCFSRLQGSAKRLSFAEDAAYSFPRGGSQVTGPSVNLAREAARIWGNIRFGLDIMRDDEDSRLIRAWAWDLESNTKIAADDDFKKLIFRKKGGWIKPDERDLRELTNRRGAICLRNCLLQLLPRDMIEDALSACRATVRSGGGLSRQDLVKRVVTAFSGIGVGVRMLETYLGHSLDEASDEEVAKLRGIYKSVADGQAKREEFFSFSKRTDSEAAATPVAKDAAKASDLFDESAKAETKKKPEKKAPAFDRAGAVEEIAAALEDADIYEKVEAAMQVVGIPEAGSGTLWEDAGDGQIEKLLSRVRDLVAAKD